MLELVRRNRCRGVTSGGGRAGLMQQIVLFIVCAMIESRSFHVALTTGIASWQTDGRPVGGPGRLGEMGRVSLGA